MAFTLHPAPILCLGCSRLGLGGGYWKETWECTRWRRRHLFLYLLSLSQQSRSVFIAWDTNGPSDGNCQRETLLCLLAFASSIVRHDNVTASAFLT